MNDLINRQMAIDAVLSIGHTAKLTDGDAVVRMSAVNHVLRNLPSVQPEPSTEIQEILNYLDTVLHPIVSPDNWNVYAELHDMISALPSVQPETCEGCKWEDAFGYGECYRCKRRYAEDMYEKGSV